MASQKECWQAPVQIQYDTQRSLWQLQKLTRNICLAPQMEKCKHISLIGTKRWEKPLAFFHYGAISQHLGTCNGTNATSVQVLSSFIAGMLRTKIVFCPQRPHVLGGPRYPLRDVRQHNTRTKSTN